MSRPTPFRRAIGSVTAALAGGALSLAMVVPAAAAPTGCAGSGQVAPTEVPTVRVADGVTFIDFDFAGVHSICLSDGTLVVGSLTGHLWERIDADGSIFMRFAETLSLDGALGFRGNATYNDAGWTSHVRTVGAPTGSLAGIEGQGTFSPLASDGSFTDLIAYTYH